MRSPIWRGTVEFRDGKDRLKLDNPQRFREFLSGMRGKRFDLVLREKTTEVSEEARGYYKKVVCGLISEHTGDTPNEVHEILKKQVLFPQFHRTTTKGMTSAEYREYLNAVLIYSAQTIGVPIPEPEKVDH